MDPKRSSIPVDGGRLTVEQHGEAYEVQLSLNNGLTAKVTVNKAGVAGEAITTASTPEAAALLSCEEVVNKRLKLLDETLNGEIRALAKGVLSKSDNVDTGNLLARTLQVSCPLGTSSSSRKR